MIKKRDNGSSTLLVIFIWLAAAVLPLRGLDPHKPPARYLLEEWNTPALTPGDSAYSMAQTPDGYLWFATGKKLLRYDGVDFEAVELGHNGKDDFHILYVNRQGRLWTGGFSLLTVYRDGVFETFPLESWSPGIDHIRGLREDMYGNLWIGLWSGNLVRFKDGAAVFSKNLGSAVLAIREDSRGTLWIATYKSGIYTIRNGEPVKHPLPGVKDSDGVNTILWDSRGTLWVGTDKGLTAVEPDADPGYFHLDTASGLPDNQVNRLLEDSHGNLWVGGPNGVSRIRQTEADTITVDRFLEGADVRSFLEDREKSLWIGTLAQQLKRLRDSTFFSHRRFPGFPAHHLSLLHARNRDIMVGSQTGKLARFKDGRFNVFFDSTRHELGIQPMVSLTENYRGRLLAGTVRGRLLEFRQDRLVRSIDLNWDNRDDNIVYHIYTDPRGRLWVSTLYGLFCFPRDRTDEKPVRYTTADGLSYNEVLQVYQDRGGNTWLTTVRGITFLKDGRFEKENITVYLPETLTFCVYEDPDADGVFWFSTAGGGLKRFKDGRFATISTEHGLGSDRIYSITEDDFGNFWSASLDGILKVSKNELNRLADGEIASVSCRTFGTSDGMSTGQCWYRSANGAVKTAGGEIWFTLLSGIAVVNPAFISINTEPPPLLLKNISFNGMPVAGRAGKHTFRGGGNIHFDFRAMTFILQDKVMFKYKLEGHDRDWIELDGSKPRGAHYRDLPFGEYVFRVTACNSSGVWNTEGARFSFRMVPYFHQTLVFRIAVSLLLLGMAAGLFVGGRKYIRLKKLAGKYKNSTLSSDEAEAHLQRLTALLEKEKVYRDEELSLNSLAEQMSVTPRRLSQIINEQLNKNFWDVINHYRIEEAKTLLIQKGKDAPSVLEICYDVGFNSKTSFYRAFRKFTGMSPSEFKKKNT